LKNDPEHGELWGGGKRNNQRLGEREKQIKDNENTSGEVKERKVTEGQTNRTKKGVREDKNLLRSRVRENGSWKWN